jgi:hypothetical protein
MILEDFIMTIEKIYEYLGTNGILQTHIELEGIYHVEKIRLTASNGKKLTKDNKVFFYTIIIPKNELELWYEV